MITIKSHGFKFSRPEANIVLDVSYFKNPWRDSEVRKSKVKIIRFMLDQEGMQEFVEKCVWLINHYNDTFPGENLQVAFCCSAGEYRSPAIAELVYHDLKALKVECKLEQNKNSKI